MSWEGIDIILNDAKLVSYVPIMKIKILEFHLYIYIKEITPPSSQEKDLLKMTNIHKIYEMIRAHVNNWIPRMLD